MAIPKVSVNLRVDGEFVRPFTLSGEGGGGEGADGLGYRVGDGAEPQETPEL